MSGRTSGRSAANRQQPSSPPRQHDEVGSNAPVRRVTRSQSVEPPINDARTNIKRGGRRNARQASVESDASNGSAASGRTRRTKIAARTAPLYPDLSAVGEDQELEDENEEDEDNEGPATSNQRSQSPGGMSQMSGTTAITSHSVAELQELEDTLIEILPGLLFSAYNILDQLAPAGISPEQLDSIVKELKTPGSGRAKRLKRAEENFKADRVNFGNDTYISISLILRKVFGTSDVNNGACRPDGIIQTANLATLVKDLLVTQKESSITYTYLQELESHFPDPFLSSFDGSIPWGNSNLQNQSFSVGLEIRTQMSIVGMINFKDNEGWDPQEILGAYFFNPLDQRDPKLSYFDDLSQNGQLKDIMRSTPNSKSQNRQIMARVTRIRAAFRSATDALDAGDLVDFEKLDNEFSWLNFVASVVGWTRSRLEEVTESIKLQGGADSIAQSITDVVQSGESQADLEFDPPAATSAPRQLLPAANIQASSPGQSLYDKTTVMALEKLKRGAASIDELSSKQTQQKKGKTVASSSAPGPSRNRILELAKSASDRDVEDYDPVDDDEVEAPRPTAEIVQAWNANSNDKNKENLGRGKEPVKKPSIMDHQPDAKRLEWEEPGLQSGAAPSSSKHPRQDDESEQSEDEGFQTDMRHPDSQRKNNRPTVHHRSTVPAGRSSPKRRRVIDDDKDDDVAEAERGNRERAEAELQRSARRAEREDQELDDDEEDDNDDDESGSDSPPPFTQARIAAITATQRAKLKSSQPQKRTPWSERDSQHLIDLIEAHGCSWSYLQQIAEFSEERGEVGQVALKDRARNMKVTFLKSRIPLPENFDKVPLGKKEIAIVRVVIPDFEG